jgi:ribosomal-protein-alanine N-acetyltransferase
VDQYVLRPGLPIDVPAMHALDLLCFQPPFQFDFHTMRRFASQPGAYSLLAEANWSLAGFVLVSLWRRRRQPAIAYVTTLDVHPSHRRMGLARRLMAAAESRACHQKAATMTLHVHTGNAGAIAFYESLGYLRTGEASAFYGPTTNAGIYQKTL